MGPLNVCGFTCTGKGAVIDFFRDLESTFIWPGTEGQINRFPGGFFYIWEQFIEKGKLTDEDLDRVSRLFLGTLEKDKGFLWSYFPPDTYLWLNNGMAELHSLTKGKLLDIVYRFTVEIRNSCNAAGVSRSARALLLKSCLKTFYQSTEDVILAATGRSRVVWDNLYHPFNLAQKGLFQSMNTIVVERDPRDQYIDAMQVPEFQQRYEPVSKFIDFHKRYRQLFDIQGGHIVSNLSELWRDGFTARETENGLLIYVSFESFVSEPRVRKDICQLLHIDADRVKPSPPRFDASKSSKNIGKFKTATTLGEPLEVIASSLASYCSVA